MSKKPLTISEEAKVQMPMKTVASLIALVAIGTWAYFGINEKLNQHSTKLELFEKDLQHNTEFRIKYPRGELGQSSGEAELFMLVEHIAGLLDELDSGGLCTCSNCDCIKSVDKTFENESRLDEEAFNGA